MGGKSRMIGTRDTRNTDHINVHITAMVHPDNEARNAPKLPPRYLHYISQPKADANMSHLDRDYSRLRIHWLDRQGEQPRHLANMAVSLHMRTIHHKNTIAAGDFTGGGQQVQAKAVKWHTEVLRSLRSVLGIGVVLRRHCGHGGTVVARENPHDEAVALGASRIMDDYTIPGLKRRNHRLQGRATQ